jgi:branched-chain amino acid transport system permease protein
LVQTFLNGIVQGLLFAVLGIAFSLVYATTRVFHLALGATFALAPYLLQACLRAGLPWWVGVSAALVAAVVLGWAAEDLIHWPLESQRAPGEIHLIASLGLFLIVIQTIVLAWGSDAQVVAAGIDIVNAFGPVRLTTGQLIGLAGSLFLLTATFAWLRWSDLGLQFRAMASNATLLATLGRNVRGLRRGAFALSGALAAAIAILSARDVGFDANVGMRSVLVGIAATIVGGRGSFFGAALAGLLFGILRAQVVWHSSARWEDAATFLVLALFLLLFPAGLVSIRRGRTRVEDTP